MKMSTGKTLHVLNELKQRLNDKLAECQRFKNELVEKRAQTNKLKQENKRVAVEVRVEKRLRNKLRQQMEEASDQPNIEDYIIQKKIMYDLQSTLVNWQKKVEILEMAAKKSKSLAQSAQLNLSRAHTS